MRLTHSDNVKMQDQDQGKWLQKCLCIDFTANSPETLGYQLQFKNVHH